MEQEKRFCKLCGAELDKYHMSYCSNECYYEVIGKKKQERIEKEKDKIRWQNEFIDYKDWMNCMEHFNHSCAYCGDNRAELQRDHFISKIRQGVNGKGNIVPACPNCNKSKHDENVLSWYKRQSFFSKRKFNKILKYLGYI
jgi:5-methylcytosine-specific restriction endonuclease McrA